MGPDARVGLLQGVWVLPNPFSGSLLFGKPNSLHPSASPRLV